VEPVLGVMLAMALACTMGKVWARRLGCEYAPLSALASV